MMTLSRVRRGGSWISGARSVRCANRSANVPGYRIANYGFRPVAEVAEVEDGDRVFRSGSYGFDPGFCRSAYRFRFDPGFRSVNQGFRPVAEVKEQAPGGVVCGVLRGGSWDFSPGHTRGADRYYRDPGDHYGDYGFRPVAPALVLLLACLLFGGCTSPRCSDFFGPGEARFCLPDDMRHALEKVDEMEKTGDRGPCHWDGPRYLITRHYLGAQNDFQTEISRTVILMPGDSQCVLIVESLRKDSPTGRQTETFLVPIGKR